MLLLQFSYMLFFFFYLYTIILHYTWTLMGFGSVASTAVNNDLGHHGCKHTLGLLQRGHLDKLRASAVPCRNHNGTSCRPSATFPSTGQKQEMSFLTHTVENLIWESNTVSRASSEKSACLTILWQSPTLWLSLLKECQLAKPLQISIRISSIYHRGRHCFGGLMRSPCGPVLVF